MNHCKGQPAVSKAAAAAVGQPGGGASAAASPVSGQSQLVQASPGIVEKSFRVRDEKKKYDLLFKEENKLYIYERHKNWLKQDGHT